VIDRRENCIVGSEQFMSSASAGRAVFRFRNFRFYVTARFLWGLAMQIQTVAVAWYVYDLTRDALSLGLIGLATFMPTVPLSLITGAVADRYDRRRILYVGYAIMALGAAALCVLAWQAVVWPVYVVVIFIGAARSFSNPAGQALVAATVPDEEYSSATAWTNSIIQTATVAGPAIGGLLYPLGPVVPFVVAFVCFLVATFCAWRISPPQKKLGGKPPVTWSMLVAGYRFIWGRPAILGSISLDLAAVLLGGATALLPIFASEVFHTGPWGLGVLRSMPAVGSIIAALFLAHYPMTRGVGRTMFISVVIYGLATIGFGLSTSIWPAMFCLMVLGGADVVSVVIRQSIIQIDTPDEMRGRVIAVHTIMTGTSNNLGDFESGALAHFIGAAPAVLVGGAGAVAASLIWMRLFPQLWARETFTQAK
jgi:MFS family permease